MLFFLKKDTIFEEDNIKHRVEYETDYNYVSNNHECNSSDFFTILNIKREFINNGVYLRINIIVLLSSNTN